jgi:PAS domain S-box-containing protein
VGHQATQPLLNEIDSLRRSQQELADFFDNAPVGLHWVGPDGIILRANRAELNLLGYSADEYIGHHIAEFHADEDVIRDILRRLHAGEELQEFEARLRCKDGSIKHVLMSLNVLWEDGQFIHSRCFTRDITDRKRAEESLLRQTDQFMTLVERIPDIVSRLDRDLRFSYISPTVREITGRPAHEYIGKPRTNEGLRPEWVGAREQMSRKVFETGQEQNVGVPDSDTGRRAISGMPFHTGVCAGRFRRIPDDPDAGRHGTETRRSGTATRKRGPGTVCILSEPRPAGADSKRLCV